MPLDFEILKLFEKSKTVFSATDVVEIFVEALFVDLFVVVSVSFVVDGTVIVVERMTVDWGED